MSADTLTESAEHRYWIATGRWGCDCEAACSCRPSAGTGHGPVRVPRTQTSTGRNMNGAKP